MNDQSRFSHLRVQHAMDRTPRVPGPTVRPFDTRGKPPKIEFLRHLAKGVHAHVWKVKIDGHIYALKIFNFYKRYAGPGEWDLEMSTEEELAYLHPFGCECRAYGRLQELGLEHIAARCYGYLILDQSHQKLLRRKYHLSWKKDWGFRPSSEPTPLGALFRELVEAEIVDDDDAAPDANLRRCEATMTRESAPKLIRAHKTLHRVGASSRGINTGNVLKSLFIDFSSAWTVPQRILLTGNMDNEDILEWEDQGRSDARELDVFIDNWNSNHSFGERIWDRALPSREYVKKLRSYSAKDRWEKRPWNRQNYGWKIRSEKYKWEVEEHAKRRPTSSKSKGNRLRDKGMKEIADSGGVRASRSKRVKGSR